MSTLTGLKQLDQADEHCIQIRTCRKVYSEKKGFLFFNAPNQGIDIEVKYLDTDPSAPPSIPVVLAVHGAPGSYYDFEEMIAFLKNQGVRIVAANFPDLSLIRERGIFKHTNEERSEFLHDWLKEIGVNRVDVAITHSSGVYSTIKLWQENHNLIKSLVMLNPAGHRRATAMKPAWMMNTAAYLYVTGVGRELFHSLFVHLVRALGSKVKIDEDNILNALLTCMTMTFAGVETFASTLKELSMRKTPTCYLYSEKDKLIDTIIYKEMVQILGSNLSDVFIVSNDGKNLNKGKIHIHSCFIFRSYSHLSLQFQSHQSLTIPG